METTTGATIDVTSSKSTVMRQDAARRAASSSSAGVRFMITGVAAGPTTWSCVSWADPKRKIATFFEVALKSELSSALTKK